ncbi:hypothetical protein BDY21DRAFT_283043 [Lineolata rhizophorae]|uniref:RRM domain-containing protein n=1 Tax=Lineolata rhizophorae TaxID=578093 RepID=A0A6A6P5X9_9PEZI|nr:hypothetical protein BDY21DRAFT_283043 [Lineolata rhizophorae]
MSPVQSTDFGNTTGIGQQYFVPGQPPQYYVPGNPVMAGGQAANGMSPSPAMYTPIGQLFPHGNYSHYNPVDNSPLGPNWTPRMASGEMPTLIAPRRDSLSSNENDLPGTPYTTYNTYGGTVAVVDRSPSASYGHNGTPSPSQMPQQFLVPSTPKPIEAQPNTVPIHIQMLVAQDPAIPRAIPAPNSPIKPLDRCLENRTGETNVYIRGLAPETTDDMLFSYGIRFGDIKSSKSIIDLKTNQCKGFGFIKYHNFENAENCIRGFHFLGYETSFARESFYAKLKKFADDNNCNLYVSNIPKNMNEHELATIFTPFKVCSSRVLRDMNGVGRGVGFARFSSRDECEEVIKKFNNTPVSKPGGEEHLIQIRYSDTYEQKTLKQQTAAARSFRAAEFEAGVRQARLSAQRYRGDSGSANEFENHLARDVA